MADAIIGPLVGRLQERTLSEARTLVAVSNDIRRLRDKLVFLQAFLRDAHTKRHLFSDAVSRAWLQQTRDAVFDAEDAVDHYFLQIDMSRYPWGDCRSVKYVAMFMTQVGMRHRLSKKVKSINSRLEDIIQNKDKYKLEDVNKTTDLTWKASTSISYAHRKLDFLQQPHLAIYVEEREKLMQALTPTKQEVQNEGDHPTVISVVGKSGVGKTTLVREIYERMTKEKIFPIQAMESFAPYLTATNILQVIVQQLTEDNRNCPRSMVGIMLKEKLGKEKYLLVIDGEVSSTEWMNILTSLPVDGAKGSRIVHITQDKHEELPSSYQHVLIELKPPVEKGTIELFHTRLLHMEVQDQAEFKKKILEYHEDIYRITEGLPLAVVLLSGLVQTKEFPHGWEHVFQYFKSKQSKGLDSIFSVCLDDLPHELKYCFFYFAALPANTIVEDRILVSMWMADAEGFIKPRAGRTMEEMGYIYLHELIARNLVQPVHVDDASSAGRISVTIQNKVRQLLQYEAQEESFVEVHSGNDVSTLTSARRLSLHNYTYKYVAMASLPKLRSIFSHFEQDPNEEDLKQDQSYLCCSPQYQAFTKKKKDIKSHVRGLLRGSEFLRVIYLRGIEIGEVLPDEIGNVVHLQYLGITSCSLMEIPRSIGRLTSLQTLDVRETNVRELPLTFWRIKTLRHVFGFVLKLPQIGGLKHIQTLDSIQLDASGQGLVKIIGGMIHLEYLFVWDLLEQNVMALCDALKKLENLRTLILNGKIIPSSVLTSSSLRRLKFMVLQGELKFPSELNGMDLCLPNLILLSLVDTNISQEFISKLAQLPSLATLAFYSGSYKDEQLVFHSTGFRCLKKLKIDVGILKRVEIKVGALPKLEELDVHCHNADVRRVTEKVTAGRESSIVLDLLENGS